ncbi:MAG TPA: hypothetical protein VGB94_13110, partial [Acidobacteriaceae bacterium]
MGRTSFERRVWLGGLLAGMGLLMPCVLQAQSCTTQAAMAAADRDGLAQAAQSFARQVQANDAAGVRAATIPQYAQSFDSIAAAISATAPKLAGAALQVTTLYLLDASGNAGAADTQFFCSPANASAPTIFNIPALPPGHYALATVRAESGTHAWQLSFVLQQSAGKWLLAGFIPKPATAGGHDGVWYWTQARAYAKQNQRWNAWLYYSEADALLAPVNFVSSPNRDKLHAEQENALPPQLVANGISVEHPVNVPAQGAAAMSFTAIGTQESADGRAVQLALHTPMTSVSEPAAVRAHSMAALLALLAAYPELRGAFSSAWVYADAPGQSSFGIEFNPLPAQGR